jgi:hypothetical protein
MLRNYPAALHDGGGVSERTSPTRQQARGEAASRPWLYKPRAVALALLGYAYLLVILALSIGLPFVFVYGLFTIVRAVFIQLVLKLAIPLLALARRRHGCVFQDIWDFVAFEAAPTSSPLRRRLERVCAFLWL